MNPSTELFIACVLSVAALRLWLALRHMRHVQAHRDALPPAFAGKVSLEAHQKAADYTRAKSRHGMGHVVLETFILLALTAGGGIDALHGFWGRFLEPGLLHGVLLIGSAVALASLAEIPLDWQRVFGIEQRFGFNRMTPAMFFTDLAKQTALGAALGLPLLAVVLWLMQAMGQNWWLYVWLTWMGFNLAVLTLYPTFIAPLFNKFTPLENPELRIRIENLLARCGFKASGIFVMDGSKRSSHGNAYFTGLGQSKRIVFFDTLIERLQPEEIDAVLAHELGHFKRRHVVKRVAWMFLVSLGFLWLLGWLMQQPAFFAALGAHNRDTATALLLFILAVPVFTFPLMPLMSLYSRRHEYEADDFAAAQVGAEPMGTALVKLYQDNAATLTPDPLHSLFYDSHPPAMERIGHLQRSGTNA
jgi:STE24 endopeptidase